MPETLRGACAAAVLVLAWLSFAGAPVRAAEFHVSPAGSDEAAGTEAQPFSSPERARRAVREVRSSRPGEAVTVWLHGGDYLRSSTLDLGPADSGTAADPVFWKARPGARVRWLGGRSVTNFGRVTDPAVLDRLSLGAREHVRQADLRALGITHFPGLQSRGFSRPTVPAHLELFWGGRPMTLARWPDEGSFTRIADLPREGVAGDEHGGKLGNLAGGFHYEGDRPRRWKASDDLWVHGYWAWDWANSYERVDQLDVERHWVRTAAPHGLYGFRKDQRFYFLNILEELDQPGEWYLDRGSGQLYFWPPEGSEGEALVSQLGEPLLRAVDAEFLRLEGITFEATRASAVEIRGGREVRVVGCTLRNLGNHGAVIEGGVGHGIIACEIADTGDGGVTVSGGDRKTLTPGGSFVEDSLFARQGRWSKCYVPAILLQGVGLRASHNLIRDHPHCGILYWGNDHLMDFNEIHHIALETGDVGAIYTGRDYTFRGNRIRNNYIHHTGGVGMGSMGAYMDDCVSGTEISGNVFYKVQRAAFIGGGRDHVVTNNVFVDCDPAVQIDGRGLDRSPVWRDMVDKTMRDRLGDVPLALYRERYPAMRDLDSFYGAAGTELTGEKFTGVPPENNQVARNVCVGKWLELGWHATPAHLRVTGNVVTNHPGFERPLGTNPRATDFAFGPESPVWAAGFQRLPLEQVGPRRKGEGKP